MGNGIIALKQEREINEMKHLMRENSEKKITQEKFHEIKSSSAQNESKHTVPFKFNSKGKK